MLRKARQSKTKASHATLVVNSYRTPHPTIRQPVVRFHKPLLNNVSTSLKSGVFALVRIIARSLGENVKAWACDGTAILHKNGDSTTSTTGITSIDKGGRSITDVSTDETFGVQDSCPFDVARCLGLYVLKGFMFGYDNVRL